jgi:hypothetical protein
VPVGDQGVVNSCAAWATDYTALGYWERRLGMAGGVLAPMYTYSQIVGAQNLGTTIASHLNIARQQGVDNQTDYWQGDYDYTDTPTSSERSNAASWKLTSYSELSVQPSGSSTVTQASIETALAAGDPVVIGFPVYANFMTLGVTNAGLYSEPSGAYEGGHAVTALGYDATGIRVENSWGTFWGDSGYATLSWSFVNRYVDEAVSIGPLQSSGPVNPGTAPANTTLPTISGTTSQGQTLSATSGTWSPAATSYAYQWQRSADGGASWNAIPGATAPTYVINASDLGANLRVTVTALNSAGAGSASSGAAGPIVAAAPQNTVRPAIYGLARQGETLYTTSGTWSPAPTSYGYRWQRSSDDGATWQTIAGATGSHYALGNSDLGATVRTVVAATNVAGSSLATSAGDGPVVSGAAAGTSSSPKLRVGHPRVAGRRLRFSVALAGATRSIQAVALNGSRRIKLHHAPASGHQLTFSGNLSRGRWRVTVSLIRGSGSAALRYDFVVRVGGAG